jgi:hypothetical protein
MAGNAVHLGFPAHDDQAKTVSSFALENNVIDSRLDQIGNSSENSSLKV